MDFLGRYEVEIDCQCKKVWFSLEDKDQFDFGKFVLMSFRLINAFIVFMNLMNMTFHSY